MTDEEARILDQLWSIREVRDTVSKYVFDTLEHGRPLRGRVARDVVGELKKSASLMTRERLLAIYDTQVRIARAAAQWSRIQRTKRSHPYLLYALGPSANHHPDHAAWEGALLPVDDPWWDDHLPPTKWRCRCWVRQVTRREAERLGGPTARPPSSQTNET